MLVKLGVDISRLKRGMRRALNVIDRLYIENGQEAVLTSTYEGSHSPSSLHYANLAIDIRLPHKGLPAMVEALKDSLGTKFDIIPESNHIHIEYEG